MWVETVLWLSLWATAFAFQLEAGRAGRKSLLRLEKERLSYDGASRWRR